MSPTKLFVAVFFAAAATRADAFGPEGHLIAGYLAEPQLCKAARDETDALGRVAGADPADFAELGLWADRIRSLPEWERSRPWHYMNVDGDATTLAEAERAIRAHRHPREGDVLWAIEHFSAELADRTNPPRTRADALRFLAHFVVDVHQPLHVGFQSDRGGNDVDVRYGTTVTNLHRFWDSDVLELRGWSPQRYARFLAASNSPADPADDPHRWAAESLLLRTDVYAALGGTGIHALSEQYLKQARQTTERRLVDAGRRLAATLNGVFCRSAP